MGYKVQLLSTVKLEQHLLDKATDADIVLDDVAFTQVLPIADKEVEQEIALLCMQPLSVVFTSANAVRIVGTLANHKPTEWEIYCIGYATKDAVITYFEAEGIVAMANDAASLAKLITERGITDVVFFCGDKRMDTLPLHLYEAGIAVKEVTVYTTEEVSHIIAKGYDGILFFSPGGVNSFFSCNNITKDIILFAIGNSTAAAIKEHVNNPVIICEHPSKDQMVTDAINYFHTKAIAG